MRRAGHNCAPPCDGRFAAMMAGEFVWLASLGAYAFPKLRRRSCPSVLVRYAYGKIDKIHHGEPYKFEICPFCGGDLVPPVADAGEGAES